MHSKSNALENCWGFIDSTVKPICRPEENQKVVYNGQKQVHALKYQSVVAGNGLIANLYGPGLKRGRRGQRGHNENNGPRFSRPRFRIYTGKNLKRGQRFRGPFEYKKIECSLPDFQCFSEANIVSLHPEGHFTHSKKRTRFFFEVNGIFKDFASNKGIFVKGVRDF